MSHSLYMPALAPNARITRTFTDLPNSFSVSRTDRARLEQVIDQLPSRERLLLWLVYIEDLTVLEVAAVLDLEIRDVLLSHAEAMTLLREAS